MTELFSTRLQDCIRCECLLHLQVAEENDESADVVPNLVTQKTGRFTHTTTRAMTADDDVGMGGNFARSLPVSVPPPPGMDRLSGTSIIKF